MPTYVHLHVFVDLPHVRECPMRTKFRGDKSVQDSPAVFIVRTTARVILIGARLVDARAGITQYLRSVPIAKRPSTYL